MKIRRIDLAKDYPIIKTWWEKRSGIPPDFSLFPETGVIVEHGDYLVACASLYEDKAGRIAIIEWEATNPNAPARLCFEALSHIYKFWEEYRKDHGILALLSWVESGSGHEHLLKKRSWIKCPGVRHELMAYAPSIN